MFRKGVSKHGCYPELNLTLDGFMLSRHLDQSVLNETLSSFYINLVAAPVGDFTCTTGRTAAKESYLLVGV